MLCWNITPSTLNFSESKWFIDSVNRPNLKYDVREETSNTLNEIVEIIFNRFAEAFGIIHCLTKADCDWLSQGPLKNNILCDPMTLS